MAARCLRVLLAGLPAEWSGMALVWCDQTCCESERPLSFTKLRRVPVGKKKERSCELMHIYTYIHPLFPKIALAIGVLASSMAG